MWGGSVVTFTEGLFNKPKERLVAHEYYDNPKAPAMRTKSMRTSRASSRSDLNGPDEAYGGMAQHGNVNRQQTNDVGYDAYSNPTNPLEYPAGGQQMDYGGYQQQGYAQGVGQGFPQPGYQQGGYNAGFEQGFNQGFNQGY